MKNSILKKLTRKYNLNKTAGNLDPYLQLGTGLNSDNTAALTSKMSVPLLEGRMGQYNVPSGLGLRLTNQNRISNSQYNIAGGLEGYLNKNIGNSDASFESTVGAGYGGGSTDGTGDAGFYGSADGALMLNDLSKQTRFGVKGSYGTEFAPNPGGYLGVTAKRDGLAKRGLFRGLGIEGNIGYNFKSGMPTAGINLNLRNGGPRQYGDGGMDLSFRKTNSFNCGPGVTQCGDTESPLTLQNDLGFNYNTGSSTASAQLGAGLQASLGRGDTRSGAPIISAGARGSAGIGGLTGNDIKFQKNLDAYAKLGFKRKNLSGAHDWSSGRAGFEAGAYGNYDIMNKNLKDVGVYGSYGALTGNVGYDMQNKGVKAGVGFNFEDGGVKEYNEGGYGKMSSLFMKGIKAIPRVAGALGRGAKALSFPSMVLGAGDLGKGSTVIDPETGINRFTGEQSNNMFNTMQDGGMSPEGVSLPGGTMTPIPGSDAVEFNGQSHDDGGIMVDENTEVEGGETMDKVVMSKGGAKDYFFSDHLKKGGMSYAQQHKNILQNGGGQEEINMLAKMQEKAANRDPKQVAKLGGVMKYEQGGILGETFDEYVERMQAERRENQIVNEDQFNKNMLKLQRKEDRSLPVVEQKRRKLRNLQLFVDQGRELTPEQQEEYDILSNDRNLNEGPISLDMLESPSLPIAPADDTVARSKFLVEGSPYYKEDVNKELTPPKMSDEEIKLANSTENTYDAYLACIERAGTDLPMSEEEFNKKKQKEADRLAKLMNPGMPPEAKIGAAAQFIPAIGALLTKQKDPEEYKYTPGFENPIIADRVKGQVYSAPNQNEARARLASAYTGQQRFLDTAGAGAAALSNRQALFAKKLSAEGALGAQESKDALTAENLTKKSQEMADARNAQNALAASKANAQMAQKEADRLSAVEASNVALRNARESEKVSNRMSILNNFSQGIAGVMGDSMQYKADERIAKTQGLYGIYERDRLTTALAGQINPATGKVYTQQEINMKAAGLV